MTGVAARGANLFTIAAGAGFAETLTRGLIARMGSNPLALSEVTLYLPTRRATRTLAEAFARVLGGAALLPEMHALGDVDEDEFLFDAATDDLDLPPDIGPIRQHLLLATLVRRWDLKQRGGTLTFAQAAALGRGLADFLAEAETQGADLDKLDALAPAALAQHWAEVRDFLHLLRDQWPTLLDSEGAMNPAARRNAALAALTKKLEDNPPIGSVIAAGSTGSIPATAALLRAIAHLPNGSVILPSLDRGLDNDSWERLDPGHPQYGMKQLLERMGCGRSDVADWDGEGPQDQRQALLRETLRPAPTTDAWRTLADGDHEEIAQGLEGLSLVETAHPGEEATAIALMLREQLEQDGKTAALVTPDRKLARRVAAELGRWDIVIDDSAGRPLAHTAPGAFLCLLAETAETGFSPVPLLALLKHPLAAGRMPPANFRAQIRKLDRMCLRGPRPDHGLAAIKGMIGRAKADARNERMKDAIAGVEHWFDSIVEMLSPLSDALAAKDIAIADAVAAHVKTAEALAATDSAEGAERLWSGDAGESARSLIATLSEAANGIPNIEPGSYSVVFRALTEERAVRPGFGRHPRLAILGPLEARLQSFDLIVLGGLNEDSWPRAAQMDAWLSRPMRETLGLEQPERAIGLSAHDFAVLASAPRVVLTRALKTDGSPTVPSRWWQRMVQLARGLGLESKLADTRSYAALARALGEPETREAPIKRPEPRPPVEKRPRRMSVTEIETWLRDPYAIYAKHVLRLSPLDPLDGEIGPLERGTAVHAALERFLKEYPDALPQDAELKLIALADDVFAQIELPRAVRALWYPRFMRAARWFIGEERKRRTNIARSFVEIRGTRDFDGPAGSFELRARADRVDVLKSGGGAIVDYKTGNPPTKTQVNALLAPQLPLEGAILGAGGFAETGKLDPAELVYIRFGGGAEPGEVRSIGEVSELVKDAEDRLIARIAAFDSPNTPYIPRVRPFRADMPGDYDHLARVREWSLTGWEGDEE